MLINRIVTLEELKWTLSKAQMHFPGAHSEMCRLDASRKARVFQDPAAHTEGGKEWGREKMGWGRVKLGTDVVWQGEGCRRGDLEALVSIFAALHL